jgi:hypothetical protein
LIESFHGVNNTLPDQEMKENHDDLGDNEVLVPNINKEEKETIAALSKTPIPIHESERGRLRPQREVIDGAFQYNFLRNLHMD